jgi:hypothetical protein
MIGKRGNSWVIASGTFDQLEIKSLFPFDLMKKKVVGYVNSNMIWVLYEEDEKIIKVPFARNILWFRAIASEPEFMALKQVPQIYIA